MKRLMLLSIDSLFFEDLNFLKSLPNFSKLISKGSIVNGGMHCVYPTLTYPAHTAIITGTYPKTSGIFQNTKLNLSKNPADWYWYYEDLKVPSLLDVAKLAGYKTAALAWPVFGACPSADYLIAEIWPKDETVDTKTLYNKSNSKSVMIKDGIFDRHFYKTQIMKQPFYDEFLTCCATDIIKKDTPEVMIIHYVNLDNARHHYGQNGIIINRAIMELDGWIGRIIDATIDMGVFEDTNFVITGDHGHLDINQLFNPNILLVKEGFITLDENNNIVDYTAFCHSASLSTQVVMKNPDDLKEKERLLNLLLDIKNTKEYGVEAVFDKKYCLEHFNLSGDFEFILEGVGSTVFGEDVTGDLIILSNSENYKYSKASHGHLPHKGPQPIFIGCGPSFKENYITNERYNLVDEASTFAKILNLELEKAEGIIIKEILK